MWIRDEAVVVERDARGRPRLVQGLVDDITQRRQAEESVRETEARFQMLVEQVPAGTYSWDPAERGSGAPGPVGDRLGLGAL